MNEMIIKEAQLSDLKTIQDLNFKLFQHDGRYDEALNMDWPYEKAGEDFFKKAISDEDRCCFIALGDEKVIGYLAGSVKKQYDYEHGITAELDNMLVIKEYRGQGVGKELFKEFKKWAKDKKVDRLFVSAYFDNTNAVKFYQSVGFDNYGWSLRMEVNDA